MVKLMVKRTQPVLIITAPAKVYSKWAIYSQVVALRRFGSAEETIAITGPTRRQPSSPDQYAQSQRLFQTVLQRQN